MSRDGLWGIRLLPICTTPWSPNTKKTMAPASTSPPRRPWPACGRPGLLVLDDATTTMLHTFPESLAYDQKLQDMYLAYLFSSERRWGRWWRTMWVAVLTAGAR